MSSPDPAGVESVRFDGADGQAISTRRRAGGGGVTVLLLHGWPGWSGDWESVLDQPEFSSLDDADVVVPDLRGFGSSDRPAGHDVARYGPSAHVADLRAVLDQARAERVIVAGYDLGATVAQHLAVVDPRVRGLVLGCPPYPGVGQRRFEPAVQAELWYQQLHLQAWAPDLVAHSRGTLEVYLRHFYTHWWGAGAVSEEHFQRTVDRYAEPGAFEASIGWYRARAGQRTAQATPIVPPRPIAVPTIVLWGDADPVMPIRFADRLTDYFADVELVELAGVGHFIPLEAAQEMGTALARLIAASDQG
jgi:pimeloyl-ACP methyl ester carboxylesterase